jgi:TolB-like protein
MHPKAAARTESKSLFLDDCIGEKSGHSQVSGVGSIYLTRRVIMKILFPCCAAITLYLWVLPLAAQEDGSTDSINPQEQLVLDDTALAVLPLEVLSTDPRAPSIAAAINEAILSRLSSITDLNVVASDLVLPFADSTLAPEEIARVLGVGSVLSGSLQIRDRHWGVNLQQINAEDGKTAWASGPWLPRFGQDGGLCAVGDVDFDTRLQELASNIAELVEKKVFPERTPDRQQAIAEGRARFLNSGLSYRERLDALNEPWPLIGNAASSYTDQRSEALSGAVAIAAAQIAIDSNDSVIRAEVWRVMAGVGDPYLIQPLLHSLANDDAEVVRRQAAMTLRDFLDEPGVQGALEYAGENDESEWVRSAIRFSMLSEAEQQKEFLMTALDTTNPEKERLSALFGLSYDAHLTRRTLSHEVIIAMVQLARISDSSRTRLRVWSSLKNTGDTYLVLPMTEVLATDQDEEVRATVARGLGEFLGYPGVREDIEEALQNDTSPLVRKAAEEALGSVNR